MSADEPTSVSKDTSHGTCCKHECDADDSILYRVRIERELPRDQIGIKLAVTAALPTKDTRADTTRQRVLEVLNTLIAAKWELKDLGRTVAESGVTYENLIAKTRVSMEEDRQLEQRASAASRSGLALSEIQTDYTLPIETMDQVCSELRMEALRQIEREVEETSRVTGRNWRIGKIAFEFSEQVFFVASNKGPYRVECNDVLTESTVPGRTNLDRITLIADVELRAPLAP